MLGQIFLVACGLAALSVAGIFFILFGPVPVKRSVTIVPRLSVSAPVSTTPMPSLVAQLAAPAQPAFNAFPSTMHGAAPAYQATYQGSHQATHQPTPARASKPAATPPPLPIAQTPPPVPIAAHAKPVASPPRKPKGQKVQPLPRKRAAKGTEAPSPFAPVVRHRQHREEDVATNPVPTFDAEELTHVDDN